MVNEWQSDIVSDVYGFMVICIGVCINKQMDTAFPFCMFCGKIVWYKNIASLVNDYRKNECPEVKMYQAVSHKVKNECKWEP